jgi:hypothetical protein
VAAGAGAAGAVVAIIIIIVIIVLIAYKRRVDRKIRSMSSDPVVAAQLEKLKHLEIDREQVSILHELGEGQFGKVGVCADLNHMLMFE